MILLDSSSNVLSDGVETVTETVNQTKSLLSEWSSYALNWFLGFLPGLIGAILIFILGWWVSSLIVKLIKKTMTKSGAEKAVITFVCSFVKCALRIVVIVTAVGTLGVDITSFIAALGAAAVTVGLALQDSMKNLASGVLIIINKPFKTGDYLQFEGLEGTVSKIEIMNTHLNTIDNKVIVIPNSRLTANNVVNFTANENRRVDLKINISYEDDILTAKRLLVKIAEEEPLVIKTPAPFVGVSKHSDSSIEFDYRIWCKTSDYWSVYYAVLEKVKMEFDENDITIPYNQVTVHNA